MKQLPLTIPAFESLYKEFFRSAIIKGYSPKKKEPYFPVHIREFLFFLEKKGITQISKVTALDILDYHNYLKERPNQRRGGGLSESIIRHHLHAIRLFFDYLLDTNVITSTPARLPKFTWGKYKERNIATVEEIKGIYLACQTKRDKALISIAYGCGLRRSEIQDLNTSDVMLHKGALVVRDGKGGKNRTIPLSDSVLKDLKEYVIYERPTYFTSNQNSTAFFVNKLGTRISGTKLNNRLREIVALTQNETIIQKGLTLHCLRHSIATHLTDNGATIEFIQSFLGHSEMDTSQIYAKKRKQQTNILKHFGG